MLNYIFKIYFAWNLFTSYYSVTWNSVEFNIFKFTFSQIKVKENWFKIYFIYLFLAILFAYKLFPPSLCVFQKKEGTQNKLTNYDESKYHLPYGFPTCLLCL